MFDATSHTLLSRLFRCPSPPAELDTTLRPFFAPLPDPPPPRRSRSLLRRFSTRTSRTRSPPRRARQIIDPEPTQDYIYTSRPAPARRSRRRNTISMTTRYDLREPQSAAQNPIYPAIYPDPAGAVPGYFVTPAPAYTSLPHRMAPASHAYHGPAQGYVPAAAPAAYVPPTPAPAPGPYVQQNPATYAYSPIPPATYIPSPPTPATGHIPSPPRDAHGNFIRQYSRSPRRGFIPPLPANYHPSPEQRPLPEPVAAAHPSVPGTPNAAFWPPSPPPTSTPYGSAGSSLPGTPYTAPGTPYAAPGTPYFAPGTPARSRSRSRTLGYPPTPPSSHHAHTPLPPLNVPLAYPAFAAATPALPTPMQLFIPSPFVGTPYLPTAGMGGGMTAGQILQAEIGYPAPGSAIWSGTTQGLSWPLSHDDIRHLKHQGLVQSGEIILAPYLIPNPNDVDRPILEWDVSTEPTTNVMRVTSRGTVVRMRGDGEGSVWDAPVARGVSGEGKVGRVMVQVMSGGNREECIVGELDIGSSDEEDEEVTIGQLFTELYAWSRSPLNPREVITMQRDEPSRYDRICAHYHHRMQSERGGSDVDGVRLTGEGLRMCDWLEGRRGWWGAWVAYTGDGRWVLRVGLADV